MAKASRSRRTQPEFDPSELEDLILTPAVGSGVGSHLVAPPEQPATVDRSDMATVVESNMTTVDTPDVTVVGSNLSTVAGSGAPAVWMTESGDLVPASRVKRIRLAQDVLNSAEESVYDALWAGRPGSRAAEREPCRIAQAGYDFLMKRTRLSKKTVQRIVDRLTEKGFIEIHERADIYRRTATVYRVYSYRTVLERQARRGRTHVAKIGPGFVYAHPLGNLSTVVMSDETTVDMSHLSTDPVLSTPTVVAETTLNIEQRTEGSPSSSEAGRLRELLASELGPVDDGAVRQLLAECRSRAGDCTPEEIAYFARWKLRLVRDVRNPMGFVLTAVPRHFENGGHLPVRAILRQESAERERQWRETHDYWAGIAADAGRPAAEREEARRILESFTPLETAT